MSNSAASWSAFFVAVFPATVYYSSEARYPIFIVLSVLLALYGIEKKNNKAWLWCAVPAWFHVVAIPFSLALLWRGRCLFSRWQIFISLILSGLFVPLALYQSSDVINGFWLKLRFPLYHITQNFFIRHNGLIFVLLILLGVFIALSWQYTKKHFVIIWVVPFAVWCLSVVVAPVYLFRALLPAVVLLVIVSSGRIAGYRFGLIIMCLLFGGSLLMFYTGAGRINIPSVLDSCDEDFIVTTSTGLYVLAKYHSDKQVYSYGINTNSQYLTDNAKYAINLYPPRDRIGGCVLMYDNFETLPIERVFVAGRSVIASFPVGISTELKVYK